MAQPSAALRPRADAGEGFAGNADQHNRTNGDGAQLHLKIVGAILQPHHSGGFRHNSGKHHPFIGDFAVFSGIVEVVDAMSLRKLLGCGAVGRDANGPLPH